MSHFLDSESVETIDKLAASLADVLDEPFIPSSSHASAVAQWERMREVRDSNSWTMPHPDCRRPHPGWDDRYADPAAEIKRRTVGLWLW